MDIPAAIMIDTPTAKSSDSTKDQAVGIKFRDTITVEKKRSDKSKGLVIGALKVNKNNGPLKKAVSQRKSIAQDISKPKPTSNKNKPTSVPKEQTYKETPPNCELEDTATICERIRATILGNNNSISSGPSTSFHGNSAQILTQTVVRNNSRTVPPHHIRPPNPFAEDHLNGNNDESFTPVHPSLEQEVKFVPQTNDTTDSQQGNGTTNLD
ncbi:hypothetical protein RIF29_23999 [Crotalaria pallida]|uniref:Uncharacterized protein n=1 Tax=Crotalaria pallida TaxID=3830 RepID=A0AAN9ER34_CROPI